MTTLTITKEQEQAIKLFKENGDTINSLIKGKRFALEEYRPLRSLSVEDFADIVQHNRPYKLVSTTYPPGSYVYHLLAHRVLRVGSKGFDDKIQIIGDESFGFAIIDQVRPATDKEVKQFITWQAFGRCVNEFKYGDVLELTSAEIASVCAAGSNLPTDRFITIETAQKLYNQGRIEKLYPVERIVEFKEVDLG